MTRAAVAAAVTALAGFFAPGALAAMPATAPSLVPRGVLEPSPDLRPRTELAARRATPLTSTGELERRAVVARRRAWRRAFRSARAYARGRLGRVSFAAVDEFARMRSFHGRRTFFSASLVKAMLLVAFLRDSRFRDRPLSPASRAFLQPMITRSDNDAATAVRNIVGNPGLARLARRVGMHWFASGVSWGDTALAARDQARFFHAIERYVPARHRAFALRLLSHVVPRQRWGIPEVVPGGGRGQQRVFFKGGWRPSESGWIVHQAALVVGPDGRRVSVAVLTDQDRTEGYGHETIRGIAMRLLAPLAAG